MKKWSVPLLLIAVLLFLNMAGNYTPADAADNFPDFPAERLLLKFKQNIPESIKSDIFARYDIRPIDNIEELDVQVVQIPAGRNDNRIIQLLQEENIEYIEPDFDVSADFKPNDIFYPYQWGLKKIDIQQAWDITRGSQAVKIAVCDTGINLSHPDLSAKVTDNKNFSDSPTSDDLNGHGTHIAGIVAASTNNKAGIAGISSDSYLMNVKVLDDSGRGYYSWVSHGIIWAADNGARVINLSFSGRSHSITLERAVNYARNKDCVTVASAGNNGSGIAAYPAFYPGCIAVAATDDDDNKAVFSSYGSWVDIAAPGVDIYSTLPNHSNNTPYLNYGCLSGTSISTSFVSGVAALLYTTKYGSSSDNVIDRIISSGEQSGSIWTDYAIRRLNAFNAVK